MNYNLSRFLAEYRDPDGHLFDLLKDDIDYLPDCSGAYIFTSTRTGFTYPNGKSQILYIGKANNLYSRIKGHRSSLKKLSSLRKHELKNEWYYKRYQYMRQFGCQVFWYSTRGKQDPKNLESELIEYFYDKYLSIPIGNGAFSFRQ